MNNNTATSNSYDEGHRDAHLLIKGTVEARGDAQVREMATAKAANHDGAARAFLAMAQQAFSEGQWALAVMAKDSAGREQGKRDAWADYQATAPTA